MNGTRLRTTVLVCALLTIATVAATPAVASGQSSSAGSALADQGPCVVISTDPPNAGVFLECSGSGSLYLDDQPILASGSIGS